MHWKNIAVARCGQRDETKIDQVACKRLTIFQQQSVKCLGYERSNKCKECRKGDGDREIEHDIPHNAAMRNASRGKHLERHHPPQRNSHYQPRAREKIDVKDRRSLEARYCPYRGHHERDEHRSERRSVSGHHKDAGNQNYRKNELESLKNEYPRGL